MDVTHAHEQIEVRSTPDGWDARRLGDFVSLQRGHDLTERDRRAGAVPVMGSAGENGFHDTALVKGPGVVVGRSGASFGQAHLCGTDFWPHNTALYVTDFHGNNRLFAFYFLKALDFSRHNSGGAQAVTKSEFYCSDPGGNTSAYRTRSHCRSVERCGCPYRIPGTTPRQEAPHQARRYAGIANRQKAPAMLQGGVEAADAP